MALLGRKKTNDMKNWIKKTWQNFLKSLYVEKDVV